MVEERDTEFVTRGGHGGIARLQSKAEARLGLLAAGLQEYAIFALDAAGRVDGWDDGAERIMGYRSEEIIGKHFSVFSPAEPGVADHAEWQLAQAAELGSHVDEGWLLRRDGNPGMSLAGVPFIGQAVSGTDFKRANDALGHEAGDELLTALARRLVDGLPPGCTPARVLSDLGVDLYQGWLFSRPLPADQLRAFLENPPAREPE
ncbi:diguanylate cyclase domain-containing protein [Saccharopolyspora sp. ASAGF58]|uniref:diguanylate cyclase domain-containing protein n=1 Tax=Saccharopolyspora sp. ASAGF58 TaxID=2719023 RepID=UPI00143FC849|nr:diguanylate cyclase [Saccharopolyspora sp. ASAGF58]QIZ36513.1 diguanylate cyclase [Saccharopolyspora sp. ASAGF58]